MDWSLAIEKEREALKRFVALFLSLAALADRICGRSRPVRWLVLWILRRGIVVALDCIADTGPVPEILLRKSGDSLAEARRYSRCFRAAARSVKRLLKSLDNCQAGKDGDPICPYRPPTISRVSVSRRFDGCARLKYPRRHVPSAIVLLLYTSGPGPPAPESRDSS